MRLPLLLVLGCVAISISYNQRMLDPLTALVARDLMVDPHRIVLLSSAFSLPYALAQPFLGPLSDSVGKARVIQVCAFIAIVATCVSYFVTSYEVLMALRIITGMAAGGVLPVSLALIADRIPAEQRQIALSRYMITMTLAQLFTAPISARLAEVHNWHSSMLVAVLLGIFGLGLMLWQVKPNPNAVRLPLSPARVIDTYRTIISLRRTRICYFAVLMEGTFVFAFTPHVALFLEGQGYGSVKEAGYVLGGMGIGGLLYGLSVSAIVRRWTVRTTMNAGSALVAAGFVTVILAANWPQVALGYAFVGFGFYMLHSGIQTEVSEAYPPARGAVIALHAFCLFSGVSLGPILCGALAEQVGYRPVLIISAVGILAATLLATTLLARPGPRRGVA